MAAYENIKININTTRRISNGKKPFIVYIVSIKQHIDGKDTSWEVSHRYSHFNELYKHLKRKYEGALEAPFPSKTYLKSPIKKQVIEKRKVMLQQYLQEVIDHPITRRDELVKKFLFLKLKKPSTGMTTIDNLANISKSPPTSRSEGPISPRDYFVSNTSTTTSSDASITTTSGDRPMLLTAAALTSLSDSADFADNQKVIADSSSVTSSDFDEDSTDELDEEIVSVEDF
eukprot:TRINITY_DN4273_c0_g1_i1.p1 TRINITY_DN4273_c0_g1~~TRINITY_DN4273_c0_g1_i1.p1  ORF type:complete len:230 (+),score=47.32 TRINITY_DN4273_c0_g1_i1:126-815(+)